MCQFPLRPKSQLDTQVQIPALPLRTPHCAISLCYGVLGESFDQHLSRFAVGAIGDPWINKRMGVWNKECGLVTR